MKEAVPPYYPVFLNLSQSPVIVIGGGAVAERKTKRLIEAGAIVTVISMTITENLKIWADENLITVLLRPFRRGDLQAARLVFAVTNSGRVNRAVCEEAGRKGIFVNMADQSMPGDFIVPAVFSGQDYRVAVASDGKNPSRSVRIRDQIRSCLSDASQKNEDKSLEN